LKRLRPLAPADLKNVRLKAPPQPSKNSARPAFQADFALRRAQFRCLRLALGHYENFFVLGPLTPPRLVSHLAALYAFCRYSDDLADEPPQDLSDQAARLRRFDAWQDELREGLKGSSRHPILRSLAYTAAKFDLPHQLFFDLLSAFRQDLTVLRYETFADLRDYSRRSADPVGRLVLRLYGYNEPGLDALSDSICTGLQLANFCQDIANDAERGRLYVPLDECRMFEVDFVHILDCKASPALEKLLHYQIVRAYKHLQAGSDLPSRLDGKLRASMRLFLAGGFQILEILQRNPLAALRGRVKLSAKHKWATLWSARKGAT